jgi:hypothetical protein
MTGLIESALMVRVEGYFGAIGFAQILYIPLSLLLFLTPSPLIQVAS